MARSALLALLIGLVSLPGCAASGLSSDAARLGTDGPPTLAIGAPAGGLDPVSHGDAFAVLVVVACVAIAAVVVADLVILPFSYRRRHLRFPCSRWVWRSCCR